MLMAQHIVAALDRLDPLNDDQWTTDGLPRVEKVAALPKDVGIEVEAIAVDVVVARSLVIWVDHVKIVTVGARVVCQTGNRQSPPGPPFEFREGFSLAVEHSAFREHHIHR